MAILPGTTIGRYHIVAELGQGGMATVYRAYDTRLRKDVAVKLIRQSAFSKETISLMLARFEQEAVSLARLTHPNIIPIIDYDNYDGAPFLVMPFIAGGTLKERVTQMTAARKVMGAVEAVHWLVPVARALDYAHQRGVLHRDVKPANILITESGDPMLTDFGIARILDVDGNTLTGVGMSVGTPEYMAPEQWLSKPEPASDQYSLGVILYELLTGCRPFSADTPAAVMIKHITEPLPPPRQYAAGLSGDAERVLYTALAKESKNRFVSMSAFIQALEELSIAKPGKDTAGAVPEMVNVPAVPEPADPGSDHPLINEPTWDGSIPMVHDVETHSDLGTPLQGESSVSDPVESGVLEPLNGNDADQKVKSRSRWIWIGGGLALLIVLFAWLAGPGRRDQIITPPIEPIAAAGQINTLTAAPAKTETFTPEPTLTFTATPTPTLTATPTPIPVIGPDHIPHFVQGLAEHTGLVQECGLLPGWTDPGIRIK
jgi:serine/threonine protein kinase